MIWYRRLMLFLSFKGEGECIDIGRLAFCLRITTLQMYKLYYISMLVYRGQIQSLQIHHLTQSNISINLFVFISLHCPGIMHCVARMHVQINHPTGINQKYMCQRGRWGICMFILEHGTLKPLSTNKVRIPIFSLVLKT